MHIIFLTVQRSHCLRRIQSAEDDFLELPEHHQQYLPNFRDNLDVMRTCVAHNHEVIKIMIQDAETMFENRNHALVNVCHKFQKSFFQY